MKITRYYRSPVGMIGITVKECAVAAVFFAADTENLTQKNKEAHENKVIGETIKQLDEYFRGERTIFSLPVSFETGTPFQKKVWSALLTIPYGETRSYKEIAEEAESPKAFRAVGMANNRNPLAIIVPCHRVIGADGSMVGYGSGVAIKERLLELEKSKKD